jgi:hypothetical protein
MKFSIVPKSDIVVDGHSFSHEKPLGEIDAPIALDRLQSLFAANMLSITTWPPIADMGPAPPEPTVEAIIRSEEPATEPPSSSGTSSDPNVAELAALEFPGLKQRLAIALYEQGLETAELVRQFVDDGQDLEELAQIGRSAKREILDWLDQHLPPPDPA